ncbi:MAG TPA: hypothetical protein VEV62_06645, partial [Parafilimonas sp.]|nr:hypothetical protein [Parafilimonas sp.]
FEEELGKKVFAKKFIELTPVKSKSKKTIYAFAAEEDFDTTNITSNLCWVDWPPRSGKRIEIPEINKAEWFNVETAKEKIIGYQLPLIAELRNKINA